MDFSQCLSHDAATSAQYLQPAQARKMERNVEKPRLEISFAESLEKSMARLRRARCTIELLVMKIVIETPTATGATRGSW